MKRRGVKPRKKGYLIVVMDAMWFTLDDIEHTVYLTGFRSVHEDTLHFSPPILRPGHESQKQWREIISLIEEEVRNRVYAVVSDSFSGSGGIAKKQGVTLGSDILNLECFRSLLRLG